MKIIVIDNKSYRLTELLASLNDHEIKTMPWNAIDLMAIDQFDCVILTGTSLSGFFKQQKIHPAELKLIKESNKPILGICAGFQLIAEAYGATIINKKDKIRGIKEIKIVQNDPIFYGLTKIEAFQSHHRIVTAVSDPLLVLGNSPDGIEVIRHRERMVYGFQFHPEVAPNETSGRQLIENFLSIVTFSAKKI